MKQARQQIFFYLLSRGGNQAPEKQAAHSTHHHLYHLSPSASSRESIGFDLTPDFKSEPSSGAVWSENIALGPPALRCKCITRAPACVTQCTLIALQLSGSGPHASSQGFVPGTSQGTLGFSSVPVGEDAYLDSLWESLTRADSPPQAENDRRHGLSHSRRFSLFPRFSFRGEACRAS